MRTTLIFSILLFLISFSAFAQTREHTVKQGDTLAKISKHYGVSQVELKKLNGIKKEKQLELDATLLIPDTLLGNARRKHIIKSGDTIAKVAKRYKVSQKELKSLNRIKSNKHLKLGRTLAIPNKPGDKGPQKNASTKTRSKKRKVKWAGGVKGLAITGEKTEGGVNHVAVKGQTIKMIASAYNVNAKRLARRNKVGLNKPLKADTQIFIKRAKRVVPVRTPKYRPHSVQFIRFKKNKRMKIKLIKKSGGVHPRGKRALSRLLGYRNRMHPRLTLLLQRVAERFPGKPIVIISGYRKAIKRKKTQSMHTKGRALDFKVQGVPNTLVYEFISKFEKVGAGYYPNSTHVHLDTRDKKYLWTDVSGKDQGPIYVKKEDQRHFSNVEPFIQDDGSIENPTTLATNKASLRSN